MGRFVSSTQKLSGLGIKRPSSWRKRSSRAGACLLWEAEIVTNDPAVIRQVSPNARTVFRQVCTSEVLVKCSHCNREHWATLFLLHGPTVRRGEQKIYPGYAQCRTCLRVARFEFEWPKPDGVIVYAKQLGDTFHATRDDDDLPWIAEQNRAKKWKTKKTGAARK